MEWLLAVNAAGATHVSDAFSTLPSLVTAEGIAEWFDAVGSGVGITV